jgi:effector-binding domain-containing protein
MSDVTTSTIEVRTLSEQYTAVVYGTGGRDDLDSWVPAAIETARKYLQKWGAGPVGDPYIRFVDGEIEAGFAATTPVGGEGDVEPSELPAGLAAVTVASGPDAVEDAIESLSTWIAERGEVAVGAPWEVLVDGTQDGRREVVQIYRSAG